MDTMTTIDEARSQWEAHCIRVACPQDTWTEAEKAEWITVAAQNIENLRMVQAAPTSRMGCSACGDSVPAKRRGSEWLCADCRNGG